MGSRSKYGNCRCQLGWKRKNRQQRKDTLLRYFPHLENNEDEVKRLVKATDFSKLPEEVQEELFAKL